VDSPAHTLRLVGCVGSTSIAAHSHIHRIAIRKCLGRCAIDPTLPTRKTSFHSVSGALVQQMRYSCVHVHSLTRHPIAISREVRQAVLRRLRLHAWNSTF
jgi:hypothetical protein